MEHKQQEKSIHPPKFSQGKFRRVQKMNEQWMEKQQMKRRRLRAIRQYLIAGILAVGGILATLVATETGGKSTRKRLSIIFIGLIVLLASLFVIDPIEEPVDTTSDLVRDEQESVSVIPNLFKQSGDELHFVNYAIDGDTIKVDGNTSVRLLGINAPEKEECYYEEATNALASLVEGEYVRLEKDVSGQDTYGRLLRYVFLPSKDLTEDDIFVNVYLLRNGYAQTYSKPPNKRYNQYFISAREQALRQNRGLWGTCDDAIEKYKQENEGLREIDEPPPNPDCIIKGNISKRESGKTYLTPKCGNYNRVKIDTSRGEQYFCTEGGAMAAGFRKAGDCP